MAVVNWRRLLCCSAILPVLIVVLAVAPSVDAGEPERALDPDTLNAMGTDVGVDDEGLFAGAVTRAQTGMTITGPSNLHVYRLADRTLHNEYTQTETVSDSFEQMVAVPASDEDGAKHFAVAGPDRRIFVFDRDLGSDSNPKYSTQYDSFLPNDIAISGGGEWIAVGFDQIGEDQGRVETLKASHDDVGDDGDYDQTNFDNLDNPVTAVAITPGVVEEQDIVVAVGTAEAGGGSGVKFYFDRDIDTATTFSRSVNAVNDIEFSRDSTYAVVGTAAEAGGDSGGIYFYGRPSPDATRYDQFVTRVTQPSASVTEVAVTADGTFYAAGTGDGRIEFYENTAIDDPDSHTARRKATWEHPDGSAVDDLAVSNDGRYFVAAAGGSMWGFARDTGKVIWEVDDVQGSVDHVDVSGDGERFVAVANADQGRTYAWEHQRDLDISLDPPEPSTKPREMVSVDVNATNNGSNVDTFTFLISAPSGWNVQPPKVTEEILPGRSHNFTLELMPPKREPPGIYATKIRTSSEDQGGIIGETFVNTTVPRVDRINITTKNQSIQVDAGTEKIVPFNVDNKGNDRAYVNVSDIRQSHSTASVWDAQIREWEPEKPVQIERGASTTLTLAIRAPGDAVDGDYSRMTVILDAGGDEDTLNVTARVNPRFDFDATLTQDRLEIEPGEFRDIELILTNRGNTLDIIRVNRTVTPEDIKHHWDVEIPPGKGNVTLGQGETKSVRVRVQPGVDDPEPATIRFTLDSEGPPQQRLTLDVRQPPDDENGIPAPGLGAAIAASLAAAGIRSRARQRGG